MTTVETWIGHTHIGLMVSKVDRLFDPCTAVLTPDQARELASDLVAKSDQLEKKLLTIHGHQVDALAARC